MHLILGCRDICKIANEQQCFLWLMAMSNFIKYVLPYTLHRSTSLFYIYRQMLLTIRLLYRKPPKPVLLTLNCSFFKGLVLVSTEVRKLCVCQIFNWEDAFFYKIKRMMVLLLSILGQDYK